MLITKSKFLYLGGVLVLSALMAVRASAEQLDAASGTLVSAEFCSTVTGALAGGAAAPAPAVPVTAGANSDEQPAEPKPLNPVRKSCAGGQVRMVVGITPADALGNPASHRHFGHTIMDKVPLTVVLDLDPAVRLDFSTLLEHGVIGFAGSDFTLYKAADGEPPAVSIVGPLAKEGRQVYVVNLIVQTAVFKPSVVFNLDLRYATAMLPDGKTPNWMPLTTPDFLVSKMTVVDNGTELLEGDLSERGERLPWPALSALALGAILMVLHSAVRLVKWFSRVRPRKVIAPNRRAWLVFDSNYKEAKSSGLKVKHLKACAHALRVYLASLPQLAHIDALTGTEISAQFPDADPTQLATIVRVITVFEEEIFAAGADRSSETPVGLSEAELERLFNDIESLVPRTWDSKE